MTATASGEVLVDISAWIDYFRQREPCHGMVAAKERGASLLTNDRHFDWLSEPFGLELKAPVPRGAAP